MSAGVVYREGIAEHEIEALARLLESVGFHEKARDRARFGEAVRGSRFVVTAWEGTELVGACRAFSDGVYGAYVTDVAVRPDRQGRGIGRELLRVLLAGREGISFVLHADPPVRGFYRKLGFEDAGGMFRRPRK